MNLNEVMDRIDSCKERGAIGDMSALAYQLVTALGAAGIKDLAKPGGTSAASGTTIQYFCIVDGPFGYEVTGSGPTPEHALMNAYKAYFNQAVSRNDEDTVLALIEEGELRGKPSELNDHWGANIYEVTANGSGFSEDMMSFTENVLEKADNLWRIIKNEKASK